MNESQMGNGSNCYGKSHLLCVADTWPAVVATLATDPLGASPLFYARRARDDLQGPCVDLRGAARGAANLEKRMREKREKEAHDRDLRDALAEEAARYQAEARHAKQAVALDFTEAPRRKPPRRLARQAGPPEEGAD